MSDLHKALTDIGRIRLQMDVQGTLGRLLIAQGQRKAAQRHVASARALNEAIVHSFRASNETP